MPPPVNTKSEPLIIDKTDEIYEKLLETGTGENKGFSPSSLSTYLSCSLKFYFSKILKISLPDEMEEEIAQNTRGSIIHDVLEEIYKTEAAGRNKFDDTFFDNALKNYNEILDRKYKKHYKKGDTEHGNNLLLKKLDSRMIEGFLNYDKKFSNGITGVICEQKLKTTLPVETRDGIKEITIKGYADRIDVLNGEKRIIDYKTGKAEAKDLNIGDVGGENWEELFAGNKYSKAFQLLTYALIYTLQTGNGSPVTPMIAALKTKNIYFKLKINDDSRVDSEILDNFKAGLIDLLTEIYDKDIPFGQTDDIKQCTYCDYVNICNR
jgi:ATP-dependent helicase/DNAse subunit B